MTGPVRFYYSNIYIKVSQVNYIGLDYKIRVKTMRGSKARPRVIDYCYLSEFLRGSNGVCDLRKVV